MKTSADPVRDYLSAVGREASALPADRRRELLADLAEHIEVTRAERPHVTIGEVLAELGDPRTIAATALAEAGGGAAEAVGTPAGGGADAPARSGRVHPVVPLLMLTLPFLLASVFPHVPAVGFCSTLFRVIGAVLLCTSVHWSTGRKTAGVLLTAVLPTVAISIWTWSGAAPAGDTAATLANVAALALLAGTTAWLWRVRRA
ncbi:HAAS signaling domain-containing protein [Streptomyces sp. NPDC051546]|uniref:HAAS signaling domain-containing protein n=1 Tax=Streptomyces sp. NPDC051546 TaxID=3365655 RepID=UPI0037B8A390